MREWGTLKAGTIVAGTVSALLSLCTMAVSVLLARMLPQEELGGYYLLVQTVILLGVVFMSLGLMRGTLPAPALITPEPAASEPREPSAGAG